MPDSKSPEFFSTVPISVPVVVPEAEDIPMNGFIWSDDFGILVSSNDNGQGAVDELYRLRAPMDDIDLNDQAIRGLGDV